MIEQQIPSSLQDLKEFEYTTKIGSYHPHFEGKPEAYWPTTKTDLCLNIVLFMAVTLIFTGLTVASVEWCITYGTENYALSWSIMVCVFVFAFIILAFSKSKSHSRTEQKMIKSKINKKKEEIMKQFLNRRNISCHDQMQHLE